MQYFLMFIGGLIGAMIHVLVKIRGIRKRNPKCTFKDIWGVYWGEDWNSALVTFLVILAGMFISSEWLHLSPETADAPKTLSELVQVRIINFVKTVFIGIGYCADAIVYAFLGTTEEKLFNRAKAGGVNTDQ